MTSISRDELTNRQDLIGQLESKVTYIFEDVPDDGEIKQTDLIGFKASNMVRMQRSLSWLSRECMLDVPDPDIRFILHWIAFEALYSKTDAASYGKESSKSTSREIMDFFAQFDIIKSDHQSMVEATKEVWEHIISLMKNPYIDGRCWQLYFKTANNKAGSRKKIFVHDKTLPKKGSLQDRKQFFELMKQLFQRLYLLRNQLFHGNATYKGPTLGSAAQASRSDQIVSGANVLYELLPVIITCMLSAMELYPESDRWGRIPFPRIVAKN